MAAKNRRWPKGNTKKPKQDFVSAKVVNLKALQAFLERQSYEVLELRQQWRHVHGILLDGGEKAFVKVATTPGIGRRTRNEAKWNQELNKQKKRCYEHKLIVPAIRKTGRFNSCFYYIADYYPGSLLANQDPSRTSQLAKMLPQVASLSCFLLKCKNLNLPLDSAYKHLKHPGRKYRKSIEVRYSTIKRSDLHDILECSLQIESLYRPAVNHGDFVPWHMIPNKGRVVLIDGEHAFSYKPRYYDIAYFYHRLYSCTGRRELSRQYLRLIRKRLKLSEKRDFDKRFPPVLAARIIGGFADVHIFPDQKEKVHWHERLKRDFEKGDIF